MFLPACSGIHVQQEPGWIMLSPVQPADQLSLAHRTNRKHSETNFAFPAWCGEVGAEGVTQGVSPRKRSACGSPYLIGAGSDIQG